MNQVNDGTPLRGPRAARDLTNLTLSELMVAGHELRRRSKAVFEDLAALEEQLRKHLPRDRGIRRQDLS
jgi:hypothetical protein